MFLQELDRWSAKERNCQELGQIFEPWLRIGLESANRTFRLANAAIDAFGESAREKMRSMQTCCIGFS
jgi:hypothetical protein